MSGPDDRALVVGIDAYDNLPLPTCVADADEIASLLARNGDENASLGYTVSRVTVSSGDPLPTRDETLDRLITTLDDAAQHDFVFYFSGHGTTNDWGTDLVLDDEDPMATVAMHEVLALIARSRVRQAVVILDCCFSGAFGSDPALTPRSRRVEAGPSVLPENFMLLAASRSDQVADAGSQYSAFTDLLVAGLRGGAADHLGAIHAPALFGYAGAAFGPLGQKPVFKANFSASHALRTVRPLVPYDLLRSLSLHFPPGQDEVALAPGDVVASGGTPTSVEQERYAQLAKLREYGLVLAPDDRHLSEHATASGTVRLSTSGWHLRLLAARNLI